MLTIFSDIHLTDESTAVNVAPEAFEILFNEIQNNANLKNAKEIRIIMLGDIFDLVRTDYWLKLPIDERPWNGELDINTGMNKNQKIEMHFCEILKNILKTASGNSFVNMLNSIKNKDLKIPVVVTYVVGNHDRAFNNFVSIKKILQEKLNNVDSIEFVNSYYNEQYSVLCRHGNEYDKNNYGFDLYNVLLEESGKEKNKDLFNENIFNVITIGEVVTCELMSGLIYRVNKELNDKEFTKLLMDVNNVRPMLNVFSWLYWYGQTLNSTKKSVLMKSFAESLEAVVESDLAKKWTMIANPWLLKWDLIDIFRILLSLIKGKEFDEVSKYLEIAKWIEKIIPDKDYCLIAAQNEWEDVKYKNIQYVFYGHTHESRNNFFQGNTNNTVKMYINTGTYLPYIIQAEDRNGFAESYQMTLAFVYSKDEDTRGTKNKINPSIDLWNGIKRKLYN